MGVGVTAAVGAGSVWVQAASRNRLDARKQNQLERLRMPAIMVHRAQQGNVRQAVVAWDGGWTAPDAGDRLVVEEATMNAILAELLRTRPIGLYRHRKVTQSSCYRAEQRYLGAWS